MQRSHTNVRDGGDRAALALLPLLHGIATREIRHEQALGNVDAGWIDPKDVVDEVMTWILSGFSDQVTGAAPEDLEHAAREAVRKAIQAHVNRFAEEQESLISMDGRVPEEKGSVHELDLGDQVLDFWVMDEDLRMEDVLPDPTARDPESVVADKEGRKVLMNALMLLPADLRYVFIQTVMDDASKTDLMTYMGHDGRRVEADLREAALQLAERLSGTHARFSPADVVGLYRQLAQTFHVDAGSLARARA